jgi:hypothetical protein
MMIEERTALKSSHLRLRQWDLWVFSGLVALIVVSTAGTPVRADVIYSGNGAGASIITLGQTAYQSASTAAIVSATTPVSYTNYDSNNNPSPGSVTVTTDASASATPGAANLLQLQTSFSAPNPGNFAGPTSPFTGILESASWGNVTTTVQAPAGSPLPSSIQLEFQVNYAPADADTYNGLRSAYIGLTGAPLLLLPPAGQAIQNAEQPAQTQPNGSLTADFHLHVPLSASGVSTNTFSVMLAATFPGITSNTATSINDAMSVSLKGVYLPDGTPVSADGYNVSFNSVAGPFELEPVPEPAMWTVWGAITAVGALMLRRRAGNSNALEPTTQRSGIIAAGPRR